MTCHNKGREPMVTMGLGTSSEYPRSLMPSPPQNSTTFILDPFSVDRHFGNRHDKATAPLADVIELRHDLGLEIPGQYDNVIRLGFGDPVRMVNRDVAAGQVPALLIGTAVDGELNEILADPAVVDQGGAFARRTVSSYRFTFTGGF